MPDAANRRNNSAPWWGLLFAIAAIGCNAALFISPPLQGALPWLGLSSCVVSLIFLFAGLQRAFGQPHIYRGKVLSVVLTIVSLFPIGLTAFVSVVTRRLPDAAAAPQVGQKVPDFTLLDTTGKQVSLDQLLSAPSGSEASAPKAVLLIFYRGYW